MVTQTILGTAVLLRTFNPLPTPMPDTPSASLVVEKQVLAEHELDLTTRLPEKNASLVFADNILLTLHYLKGDILDEKYQKQEKYHQYQREFNWEKVREPFEVSFTLEPGEVFAYHDTLLPEFQSLPLKTTNAHYTLREGYKPLAGLPGNGVCHLASLINWVASEARLAEDGESKRAGLEVTAKVNHDFYPVPGVPKENGTSIRWGPNGEFNSRNQNLYVVNQFDFPVIFRFKADEERVLFSIVK